MIIERFIRAEHRLLVVGGKGGCVPGRGRERHGNGRATYARGWWTW